MRNKTAEHSDIISKCQKVEGYGQRGRFSEAFKPTVYLHIKRHNNAVKDTDECYLRQNPFGKQHGSSLSNIYSKTKFKRLPLLFSSSRGNIAFGYANLNTTTLATRISRTEQIRIKSHNL